MVKAKLSPGWMAGIRISAPSMDLSMRRVELVHMPECHMQVALHHCPPPPPPQVPAHAMIGSSSLMTLPPGGPPALPSACMCRDQLLILDDIASSHLWHLPRNFVLYHNLTTADF